MNEIVHAYVKNILAPQVVSRTHPAKINEFYETLLYIVQSFEKLGKTLELLEINAELVQGDPNFQSWGFTKLINSLRTWKEIHAREIAKHRELRSSNQQNFHVQERYPPAPQGGVDCNDPAHKPTVCPIISSAADRTKLLQEKRLCFNCTGPHRVTQCRTRLRQLLKL